MAAASQRAPPRARGCGATCNRRRRFCSRVRQKTPSNGPPRVTGHTTYRSVIPTERESEELRLNAATILAGPEWHIAHDPLSRW
jgi:hypothetical protein